MYDYVLFDLDGTLTDSARGILALSLIHIFAGQSDVLFEGQVGAVDHDGGKATVDAALAGLEIGAVIQMHNDRQIGVLNSSLDQLHQVYVLGVLARARGYLQEMCIRDRCCVGCP